MNEPFARPHLFSHRGLGYGGKENTLQAFSSCLQQDHLDGIELDVQQTSDGKLVVIHDYTLKRVASNEARISCLPYAKLKDLYADLPLLEEVFSLCKDHLLYDLEIKSESLSNQGLEKRLLALIDAHHLSKHVVVSSFNPVSLLRFKRLAGPAIPTALIYSTVASVPAVLRHGLGRYLARPTYLKPEQAQTEQALKHSHQVVTWTVDDLQSAKQLLNAGVMGIISNKPGELASLFNY